TPLFVENFEEHVTYMEGFHSRYIGTNKAIAIWLQKARRLPVKMIAPQHGSIFKDEMVGKFFDWIAGIRCGFDVMNL
ncbi:MAG: oxygen-binding di-iron domain-containing protein, partial [Leptospirillum sp.]